MRKTEWFASCIVMKYIWCAVFVLGGWCVCVCVGDNRKALCYVSASSFLSAAFLF